MAQLILKVITALFFWGIFLYVIFFIPYPNSLTQASPYHLLSFFIPLFLALIFTFNILLKSILKSIILSFGIIIFLILKALDSLNIVSLILTVIAVGLLLSYFKPPKDLNSTSKIPKLRSLRRKK